MPADLSPAVLAADVLADRVRAAIPFRTHAEVLTAAAERFAADTGGHVLEVRHDDGLYRHLRFRRPGSSLYWFDLVTWPGSLTLHGDMGTYVFSRLEDMFAFFRGERINPGYWAEKLQTADRGRTYSPDRFREHVADAVADWAADLAEDGDGTAAEISARVDSMIAAVTSDVLAAADDEHEAQVSLDSFAHDGFTFTDTWDWDLREHTEHFLWCCHAITWGIGRYDAAGRAGTEGTAA